MKGRIRPKKERVAPDTNIIVSVLKREPTSKVSKKALNKMKHRDHFILLGTVYDEIGVSKSSRLNKDEKKRFRNFSEKNRSKVIRKDSSKTDIERYKSVKGNDRKVLDEAKKSNVDRIVTMDKKFSRNDGKYGIKLSSPSEYLKKFKRKK